MGQLSREKRHLERLNSSRLRKLPEDIRLHRNALGQGHDFNSRTTLFASPGRGQDASHAEASPAKKRRDENVNPSPISARKRHIITIPEGSQSERPSYRRSGQVDALPFASARNKRNSELGDDTSRTVSGLGNRVLRKGIRELAAIASEKQHARSNSNSTESSGYGDFDRTPKRRAPAPLDYSQTGFRSAITKTVGALRVAEALKVRKTRR
eukprot:1180401-Prorocentrum_minimum.AAC.1